MPEPASRRIDYGKLVDLAVLLGAWAFCAWAVVRYAAGREEYVAMILVLTAPVTALLLQIRLAPRLAALAQKPRREELAVTLLSAREFLIERLRAPVLRVLAPAATLLPVTFAIIALDDPGDFFPEGPVFLFVLVSAPSISAAGLADLFARLLRRDCDPGAALLLIPICWSLAAIGAPFGGLFVIELMGWILLGGEMAIIVVLLLTLGAFLNVGAFSIAVRRWKTACRRYYQFEFD